MHLRHGYKTSSGHADKIRKITISDMKNLIISTLLNQCIWYVYNEVPDNFIPIVNYIEMTYVQGRWAVSRGKAVPIRYAPELWNQFNAVLQGTTQTNNSSKG